MLSKYRFLPNKRRYSIWHILSGTDHLFGKFIYLVRYCIWQVEMRSAHIIGKNAPVFGVAVNKKGSFFVLVFGLLYLYLGQHTCIWPASILVWGRSILRSRREVVSNSKEGTIAKILPNFPI